ncbi:MAG TPA: THxN family PEP-CTERM protein, partial [Luteitalea sp.]|nr:THxN family PEP-CTERM protein [Luteitalea sp.]
MKSLLGTLVVVALSAGSASAATIPLQVAASWSNAVGGTNVSYNPGAGTLDDNPLVSWGTPVTSAGKSSYRFVSTFPVEFGSAPVGPQFRVGTFTHNNRTIALGSGIQSVQLDLEFDFLDASTSPDAIGAMALVFHTETPNESAACPGDAVACNDIVTVGNELNVVQQFHYNGRQYQLMVLGFSVDAGLTFSNQFITQENLANTADLYAVITPVVPEPGTLVLLGAGLIA